MNSRQPPNKHYCVSGTINEEDNARSVEKWLQSGDFTPKLFEKHLRHTAKDISQGLRDGKEVTWSLVGSIWFDKSEVTSLLRALSSALASVILPASTSPIKRMQIEATLGSFVYYKNHRNDARGSVIDVYSSLADALKSIRSFVLTNDTWADEVDESFRSASPLYKLSETQFVDTICGKLGAFDSEELWHECEKMRRTTNALARLTGNHHPDFYTCWECDKILENILECGKCNAALYCGRKCQKMAWKGGHKKKCNRLKLMHECLLTNVEEAERAHVTGVQDGLELSPQTDCVVLRLCVGVGYVAGYGAELLQLSMKNFYENLARIIRGEWWVFHLSDQEESTKNSAKDKTHPDILEVLQLLTVDWFGYARFKLASASVVPQQVTALTDPLFRSKCSAPFSANALLDIYRVVKPDMSVRPHFKLTLYKYLRVLHDEFQDIVHGNPEAK